MVITFRSHIGAKRRARQTRAKPAQQQPASLNAKGLVRTVGKILNEIGPNKLLAARAMRHTRGADIYPLSPRQVADLDEAYAEAATEAARREAARGRKLP